MLFSVTVLSESISDTDLQNENTANTSGSDSTRAGTQPAPRGGGCTQAKCVRALKGLALPRESLQRDRPGGLTSPVFHACGSASPFRARCCHSSHKTVHPPPLP
jgi:hypothetical protein